MRRRSTERAAATRVAPLLVALVGLGLASCGRDTSLPPPNSGPGAAVGAALAGPNPTKASGTLQLPRHELQSTLDGLFQRHVQLVLATTAPPAIGRSVDAATRAQLDRNSDDVTAAIVGVYGPDAAVFGDGWRKHVQAFVDYATATGNHDAAAQADAKARLDKYPKQVGAFLAGANPTLTQQAVADLVADHIADVVPLIDQQGASPSGTLPAEQTGHAAAHMTGLATALADAIAKQFPARFPG